MPTDPMWCFENYGEAAEYIDQLEKQRDELLVALAEYIDQLEKQRDELLVALKDAISRLNYARDKLMDAENVIPDESNEELSLQSAIAEMNRHIRSVKESIAKAEG